MTRHHVSTLLFSLNGRITRSTYWVTFVLPWLAVYNGLVLLDAAVGTWDAKERLGVFATIFVLLSLYPAVAAGVKRSHDRGRSGWFVLVSLIPVVNLWPLVEWGLLPGPTEPNRYGPPGPSAIRHASPHSRSVSMTAVVLGVLVVLLHGGVTVFVVPTFGKMLGDLRVELPAGTRALFGLSQRGVLGSLLALIDVGLLLVWLRLATKDWRRLLLGLVPMYVAITAALVGVLYHAVSRAVSPMP